MRKSLVQVAVAASVLFAPLVAANPAQAGTDGNCGSGEVCLYYGYSLQLPLYDSPGDVSSYAGKTFWGSSFVLNDNVASAKSRATFFDCFLYEHANYAGAVKRIYTGNTYNDLGVMSNQASSHNW